MDWNRIHSMLGLILYMQIVHSASTFFIAFALKLVVGSLRVIKSILLQPVFCVCTALHEIIMRWTKAQEEGYGTIYNAYHRAAGGEGANGGGIGDNCGNVRIKIAQNVSAACVWVLMKCEYAITTAMTVELKGSVARGQSEYTMAMS